MAETDAHPPMAAPLVDISALYEQSPGVWIIPDGRVPLVPNIGIVLGTHSALVVDCGMGPANGAAVLEAARRVAGDRLLLLTLSHFHPEHGYGAQAFEAQATIVYNEAQRVDLFAKGQAYLDNFRGFGPSVAAALEGTRFVAPHIVYHGAGCDLDLGDRLVQLRHWGMAHTGGDQVVYLPAERILFTGDLAEEGIFPIFPWFPPDDVSIDGPNWIAVLKTCEAWQPAVVVPGHGAVGGVAIVTAVRTYLETIAREVAIQRAAGASVEAMRATLRPRILAAYPTWQAPEWIDHAIAYFAQLNEPAP